MLKIKDNVDLRKMQPNKLKFKGIIVLPDRTIFLEKTELEIKATFEDIEWNYDKNNNIHEEYVISQLKDYENKIKQLEEENKRLKATNEFVTNECNKVGNENIELANRINKAIEYIKTCNPDVDLNSMFLNESYISNYGANDLLKILKGE